jgi:hypothetical protein
VQSSLDLSGLKMDDDHQELFLIPLPKGMIVFKKFATGEKSTQTANNYIATASGYSPYLNWLTCLKDS